ncbi:DUF3467 domain-containing protein [uncultured Albimonas sp.]|uniref:DUF3467 domain-containing protein n=1 Tax=uncultured Albimonas sp. TaxID=1331701 RepID=UPI0030EDFDFE|tara:strand:+ start:448 stop:768 length:321 start_codon:yes stop_codon:yes gene_type:complete
MKNGDADASTGPQGEAARRDSSIEWDDAGMATNFANVVNIQGTREQIELFFGTNRTWNIKDDAALKVELTNRMILTPLAAKRLHAILTRVLREYEQRHGALKVDGG